MHHGVHAAACREPSAAASCLEQLVVRGRRERASHLSAATTPGATAGGALRRLQLASLWAWPPSTSLARAPADQPSALL